VKWAIVFLLGSQYSLNFLHSYKICCLVLIRYKLYGHEKSFLGKNLRQYSPIRVWLTITLVALVYKEFEWLNWCNQGPPLIVDGSIGLRLLSNNSRKFFSLRSATWKDNFH